MTGCFRKSSLTSAVSSSLKRPFLRGLLFCEAGGTNRTTPPAWCGPWASRHSTSSSQCPFSTYAQVLTNTWYRASLVVQWLRICLPMQGTRVRALVREDPTCRGATRPVSHNYWACASGACAPNKRCRDSERPVHCDEEWPPTCRN